MKIAGKHKLTFKEDLFELFNQYEPLSDIEKATFIDALKKNSPDNAEKLQLLSQNNQDFTQQFIEKLSDYTEQLDKPTSRTGDKLGVYTLVKLLGVGGMGQVYLAKRHDGLIEQQVAIKLLHPGLYQFNSSQTLLNEAQALSNLNHPNIATILDVVKTDDGLAYIVMEYIEGRTLKDYLEQNTLTVKDKLSLFGLIADAVQEAHSKLIIHADIKPSNILIAANGQPKLIDFGIMQFIGSGDESSSFINQYLCALTINYAAPEQLEGKTATIQSDVYALGGLLYFILSGKAVFQYAGGSLAEKILMITTLNVPQCEFNEKILFKSDLDNIIKVMLEKKSEERYLTVLDLMIDLRNFISLKQLKILKDPPHKYLLKCVIRHKFTFATMSFFILSLSYLTILQVDMFVQKEQYDNVLLDNIQSGQSFLENKTGRLSKNNSLVKSYKLAILQIHNHIEFGNNESADGQLLLSTIVISLINSLDKSYEKDLEIDKLKEILLLLSIEAPMQDISSKFISILSNIDMSKFREQELLIDTLYLYFMRYMHVESNVIEPIYNNYNNNEKSLSAISAIRLLIMYGYVKLFDGEKIFPIFNKAYELALLSPSSIPIIDYYNIVSPLSQTLLSEKGDIQKYEQLMDNFIQRVNKFNRQEPRYNTYLNFILNYYLKTNFSKFEQMLFTLAGPLEHVEILLKSDNKYFLSTQELLPLLYFYHSYYFVQGDYEKAMKAINIQEKYAPKNTELMDYLLTSETKETLEALIWGRKKEIPHIEKYLDQLYSDWAETSTASFQAEYCIDLIEILSDYYSEKACLNPYSVFKKNLGSNKFWMYEIVAAKLLWISKKNNYPQENYYAELLEAKMNYFVENTKLRYLEVLINYHITRSNKSKARYLYKQYEVVAHKYWGASKSDNIFLTKGRLLSIEIDTMMKTSEKQKLESQQNLYSTN